MNNIRNVINCWKKNHDSNLFSYLVIKEEKSSNKFVAKVNLRTKVITVNIQDLFRVALHLNISPYIFLYYALNHELGHLLYKNSKKSENEEYFAHKYAYKNLCENFVLSYRDMNLLKNLDRRILH